MYSTLVLMAEGLHSKFALAKENSEKNDEISTRIQQMQEQIQELLLEARLAWQDRQERNDLTIELVAIQSKKLTIDQ